MQKWGFSAQGSDEKHFRDLARKHILSFREQGDKVPFRVSILHVSGKHVHETCTPLNPTFMQ